MEGKGASQFHLTDHKHTLCILTSYDPKKRAMLFPRNSVGWLMHIKRWKFDCMHLLSMQRLNQTHANRCKKVYCSISAL